MDRRGRSHAWRGSAGVRALWRHAISARAGETLTIHYENVGEMTRNIVVVKSEPDVPIIGEEAFQAAFTNSWIPTGADYAARMIANTPWPDRRKP